MKTHPTSVVLVVLASCLGAAALAGCGVDEACSSHLDVALPAGQAAGVVSFTGTADGTAFDCEYTVYLPDFEEAVVDGSCSEGPVELRIDRDDVTARFDRAPRRVDYVLRFVQEGGTPRMDEGTLEPAYPDGECRTADESLSPP